MFLWIVLSLAVISVLWSLWSLAELQKSKKIAHSVKKELDQGRVVYHSYSSESDSSVSRATNRLPENDFAFSSEVKDG